MAEFEVTMLRTYGINGKPVSQALDERGLCNEGE